MQATLSLRFCSCTELSLVYINGRVGLNMGGLKTGQYKMGNNMTPFIFRMCKSGLGDKMSWLKDSLTHISS